MHHHTESLVYKAHLPGKLHHLCGEFLRRCGSPSLVLKVIDDGLKQEDKWTSQPGGYEQWNLLYIRIYILWIWIWKYDFADNKSTKQSAKRCNFGHLCFSRSNLRPSHGQTTVCPGACIWGKKTASQWSLSHIFLMLNFFGGIQHTAAYIGIPHLQANSNLPIINHLQQYLQTGGQGGGILQTSVAKGHLW